jgi:hypothetical protein
LIKKIIILGIVALAVIGLAVMPSPSNFWHPSTENSKTIAVESSTTTAQVPVQNGPISDLATGAAYQSATQPAPQTKVETVPQPVYTNVTVAPEQVVITANQTLTVDIWINNVTKMAGWEFTLAWNKTIIRCAKAQVNTPAEWGGIGFDWFNKTEKDVNVSDVYTAWQFGSGIENDYNDTFGACFKAECFGPRGGRYHNTFNGSIAVVTLTFQALDSGSACLEFDTSLIGNDAAQAIAHTVYNCLVEVQSQ